VTTLGHYWFQITAADHTFFGVHIDQNERPFGVGADLSHDRATHGDGNSPDGHTLKGQFLKSFHSVTL
jgi:hypothetical protein